MGQKLRVLFVASEGVPFAKTGGLADIVGTLPQALEELGVEVKVLMPYYGMVKQGKVPTTLIAEDLEVNLGLINHPTLFGGAMVNVNVTAPGGSDPLDRNNLG